MGISAKSVHYSACHLCDGSVLIEVALLLRVGDKSHLEKDRRTGGLEQHPESRLAYSPVLAIEMPYKTFLHLLGELQRLVHVGVLHQFEHDIGVNGVRVKSLVSRLVIGLEFHHRVLAHRDIEVRLHPVGTEDKSLHSLCSFRFGGISVNRDKEVRVSLIRNIRAGLQRNKHIR